MAMRKIYILWDYDNDEYVAASTDKSLVESIYCDTYFEMAYEDYCWNWLGGEFSTEEPICQIFEDELRYMEHYFAILEIEATVEN